ncbi:hypothetical protein [Actinophytocola glycyrrhizae]|uniref:Acyl-CoA dehydrogenase-like protein n=1 Tax=Actinophytocola glycyrrhizae TaxID=2044873 RepID=A0ABV9RXM0_9PSEU
MTGVFGWLDVADFESVGYTSGLSAGLDRALADLDDADLMAAAHAGWAAVPEQRVLEGANVLEHHMATSEGVAILDVRLPVGLVPLRHAGDRPEVVGLRLAAVRIGLARKLLDQALGRGPFDLGRHGAVTSRGVAGAGSTGSRPLTGGRPLLHHRLTVGAISDVLAALTSLRGYVEGARRWQTRSAVVDVHRRLTRLDWQVAKLFGLHGDLADHPVRALFVAELAAHTWVGA